MKYLILFTSAAALVSAAPYCQPTTVKTSEPKPAAATEANVKKLPFIQSGIFGGIYCGMARDTWVQHTDYTCGTTEFCKAFDNQQRMQEFLKAKPQFKNNKECLDAHDPEPTIVKTNKPKPTVVEANEPKPTVVKTNKPKPTVVEANEPKPTVAKANEPKPTVVKTNKPKPTVVEANEPKPTVVEANEPKPTVVEANEPKPTVVEANEAKPTVVKANVKKLPFIQSGIFGGIYCGMTRDTWVQHTDYTCGTTEFCKAFDDQQRMQEFLKAKPQFKNNKECLDAHDPEPTVVKTNKPKPTVVEANEPEPTVVEASEPKPAATTEANVKKLPFIQSGIFGGIYCGMTRDTWVQHTDYTCGTTEFCKAFDDQQRMQEFLKAKPQFKNNKECLDAHDPEPTVVKTNKPKPTVV